MAELNAKHIKSHNSAHTYCNFQNGPIRNTTTALTVTKEYGEYTAVVHSRNLCYKNGNNADNGKYYWH